MGVIYQNLFCVEIRLKGTLSIDKRPAHEDGSLEKGAMWTTTFLTNDGATYL